MCKWVVCMCEKVLSLMGDDEMMTKTLSVSQNTPQWDTKYKQAAVEHLLHLLSFRNNIKYLLDLTLFQKLKWNFPDHISPAAVLSESSSTVSTSLAASSHNIPQKMALAAGKIRSPLTLCGFWAQAIWYKGHLHLLRKDCFLLKCSVPLLWPICLFIFEKLSVLGFFMQSGQNPLCLHQKLLF